MERLAQEYETMFERNIAIISSRRKEVRVDADGIVYEGFICGLDDVWLQIYGHAEFEKNNSSLAWRFVLLNKDRISSIIGTGRGLKDLDDNEREWVEKKIYNFSGISDKFLKSKDVDSNGSDR